ncbi:oxysterol-binding protein-related protein 11-like isoform X2 [Zootermopsis nevadensis]|uniref:oxysterol-binding protein-related protein 11-like isoform X2 n=1 Tax=Zootermopsis nevadensis TaxID=136037 RepID=UPI000B8E571B|nr:oxysterol-binding protein-related protein 11-like isoform X2 [Zootermopsis nevadensis]
MVQLEMSSEKLCQQFEGQLCKYTNVMKGWQFRWFLLDPETGVLDYFLNESERKQRPRGSVHLAAAVISPSDEDSNTFTVNSATGDMFKLRAADARARHEWISRIRSVAEMHTMAIAQSNPPLPPREHLVTPHSSSSLTGPGPQQGTRVHCTLAVLDAFSSARDHIHRADQSSYSLSRAIEDLPGSGPCVRNIDEEMLLLKATAQATVYCLSQCLSILQQQQIVSAHKIMLAPPSFRSTPSVPSSGGGGVFPRKTSSMHPIQYDAYDTKKSFQRKFSTVWPETSPIPFPTSNENPASISSRDELTDEEDVPESSLVPFEEHKSVILHLLSQLKLGMDLTRVVLPTFILEKRSLLEMFADCMGHPQLFVCIPDELTPFGRMMALLEWYLTSFHMGRKDSAAKKPYNPIIGETFHCSWRVLNINPASKTHTSLRAKFSHETINLSPQLGKSVAESIATDKDVDPESDSPASGQSPKLPEDSETGRSPFDITEHVKLSDTHAVTYVKAAKSNNAGLVSAETVKDLGEDKEVMSVTASEIIEVTYTAEQVSHHPPVTAFYVECPAKKMCLNASIWTKSNFSGMSVGVNMIGELNLHLGSHGERYDFTLPSAYARSIISVPWVELGGKATISCPATGYSAAIIFHTKPFYGGKVHQVTAEVRDQTGALECKVQGEWNSHYEFIYSNGESKVVNVNELLSYKKRIQKISEQRGNESRKLWYNVTQALKMGDIDAATEYKRRLEEQQRLEQRVRRESGIQFPTAYFNKKGDHWVFSNLLCES